MYYVAEFHMTDQLNSVPKWCMVVFERSRDAALVKAMRWMGPAKLVVIR